MNDDLVTRRYTSGEYARANPDWDSSDSPWKAQQVATLLDAHALSPSTIVEIGCGAGGVLRALRHRFPGAAMAGFDIAPHLVDFWHRHPDSGICFVLGDYFSQTGPRPDLVLVLDVLEHVADPHSFLARLNKICDYAVFHFPLDLSAVSVVREAPLLYVRRKVGHIHYFTKGLALALLDECGFEVVEARYTGAAFNAPGRSLRTRVAGLFRWIVCFVHRDAGVRLLGGETLMVLARARATV